MSDAITLVVAPTLGECWLQASRAILERGRDTSYDGLPIREIARMVLTVDHANPDDPLIARLGDPDWSAWMHDNFFTPKNVAELGDARSYACRLFDYEGAGRDQLAWVIDRLRGDPASRSATITTFEPLSDTAYIPCVSMLDFWAPDGRIDLVVYAHSLDFGKKAYGNLVELARLQVLVAGALELPIGSLTVVVKSAHVYEPEWELMARLAGEVEPTATQGRD
jgi:thymidylate synthase